MRFSHSVVRGGASNGPTNNGAGRARHVSSGSSARHCPGISTSKRNKTRCRPLHAGARQLMTRAPVAAFDAIGLIAVVGNANSTPTGNRPSYRAMIPLSPAGRPRRHPGPGAGSTGRVPEGSRAGTRGGR